MLKAACVMLSNLMHGLVVTRSIDQNIVTNKSRILQIITALGIATLFVITKHGDSDVLNRLQDSWDSQFADLANFWFGFSVFAL